MALPLDQICLKVCSKDIVGMLVLVNTSINIVNTYFSDTFGLRHKIRTHCAISRSPRQTIGLKGYFTVVYLRKMFFVLSRAWDKEKILSPHEESNLRSSDSALRCSTTEPQRLYSERGLLRKFI